MKFDFQPTLKGELIHLRPLRAEDFEALYAVSSDPLVWEQHPDSDRYKREVFVEFFRVAMESKGALLATDAATGEVIGSSRFTDYQPTEDVVEVGYSFLARRCWGHTYNREMKKLMVDYALRFVGAVDFYIGAGNTRSRTAIGKIGAKFLREFERVAPSGEIRKTVVYRLRRGEEAWAKG